VAYKVVTEDERDAIISVCIDVTVQNEIIHIYNNIPGAVFRCRFDEKFSVIAANNVLFDFIGYKRK